jgi:hypothetical protein
MVRPGLSRHTGNAIALKYDIMEDERPLLVKQLLFDFKIKFQPHEKLP